MYIIIMGGGRIGNNLAKSLVNRGHEVTVLENDKERATTISAELDALVVYEDGTTIRGLEEVNIFTADAFVAVTGDDGSNLTGCLLAKEYGVKITVARVADYQKQDIFKKLGVSVVVSPELTAAQAIERFIMRPDVIDLTVIGGGQAEILEMIVGERSAVVHKKLKEIPSKDFLIVAVYREEKLFIPKGDTIIEPGARIFVLAKSNMVAFVKKLFMGG
ncbi:MAG: NAD-binding protein [Candidatus Methanofastidiosa archaeon]|jgi:trk system potassium uptake protein TrkA|nr:NAD-binding protein [Candidatus Methanofastidiosa archaeon]